MYDELYWTQIYQSLTQTCHNLTRICQNLTQLVLLRSLVCIGEAAYGGTWLTFKE